MEGNFGIGIVITSAILIVSAYVFFMLADAIPHQISVVNETVKNLGAVSTNYTTSTYSSDISETSANLLCYNTSNGTFANSSFGTITTPTGANVTKAGLLQIGTPYTGIVLCNYVYQPLATGSAQATYTNINTTTYSGFELAAVVVIVVAAVSVLGGLFLLGRT